MCKWIALLAAAVALATVSGNSIARDGAGGFDVAAADRVMPAGGWHGHDWGGYGWRRHGGHWHGHHRFGGGGWWSFNDPWLWNPPPWDPFWVEPFWNDWVWADWWYPPDAWWEGPPTYVERATPEDVQRNPDATYYCPGRGYHPAVRACPDGWMRVIHPEPMLPD